MACTSSSFLRISSDKRHRLQDSSSSHHDRWLERGVEELGPERRWQEMASFPVQGSARASMR